jgi:hypothetical protein
MESKAAQRMPVHSQADNPQFTPPNSQPPCHRVVVWCSVASSLAPLFIMLHGYFVVLLLWVASLHMGAEYISLVAPLVRLEMAHPWSSNAPTLVPVASSRLHGIIAKWTAGQFLRNRSRFLTWKASPWSPTLTRFNLRIPHIPVPSVPLVGLPEIEIGLQRDTSHIRHLHSPEAQVLNLPRGRGTSPLFSTSLNVSIT